MGNHGSCGCVQAEEPPAVAEAKQDIKQKNGREETDPVCHAICGIPKSQHTELKHGFAHAGDDIKQKPMDDLVHEVEEKNDQPTKGESISHLFDTPSDINTTQSPPRGLTLTLPDSKPGSPVGLMVTVDDDELTEEGLTLHIEDTPKDSVGMMLALPSPTAGGRRKRRMSVSAESDNYASNDSTCGSPANHRTVRQSFKAPPKAQEQKDRIYAALEHCFLFTGMDEDQENKVIDAMEEKKVKTGDTIIKQYDDGDFFYVIDSGTYDVMKETDRANEPGVYKKVFAYDNKGSFGELALMYNCPRAASVVATADGVLWAVDRHLFRQIVVQETARKRMRHEDFLRRVPALSKLSQHHISQFADGLHAKTFASGAKIVTQGEIGDAFYVVEKGECVATQGDTEVGRILAGEYFGERALLKNEPRAANVTAIGETRCLSLDRATFERLFTMENVETVQDFHKQIDAYLTADQIQQKESEKRL